MSLFCKCADQMEAYKKAISLEMENFNASIRDMHRRFNEAINECTAYKVDRLNGNISIIVNKALKKFDERINLLENRKPTTIEKEVLPFKFMKQMEIMVERISNLERRFYKLDTDFEEHIYKLLNHINKNSHIHENKSKVEKDVEFQAKLQKALANNVPPKPKQGRPRKISNEQKTK